MAGPAVRVVLHVPAQAEAVAEALFARLFPERALDPKRVAVDRPLDGRRERWLGAELTGMRNVREGYVQLNRDGDEVHYERDVLWEAGRPGEPRWLRLSFEHDGLHVEVGEEDAARVPELRDLVFRAGTGHSETTIRALETVRAIGGFEQSAYGGQPGALERTRVSLRALAPRQDRALDEILARLDAAAHEDGGDAARRAAVIAAVVRLRNGRVGEGLAGLDAVLAAHTDESDAAALRALALVRAGRVDDARRALSSVPVEDELDYLTRAVALHELGDLATLLAQLDASAPDILELHARIAAAVVAERLGDAEGARARARVAIERGPSIARHFAERPPSLEAQPLLFHLRTFDPWRALHAELAGR